MRCAPAMESSLDDAMRRAFARAARGSIASSSRVHLPHPARRPSLARASLHRLSSRLRVVPRRRPSPRRRLARVAAALAVALPSRKLVRVLRFARDVFRRVRHRPRDRRRVYLYLARHRVARRRRRRHRRATFDPRASPTRSNERLSFPRRVARRLRVPSRDASLANREFARVAATRRVASRGAARASTRVLPRVEVSVGCPSARNGHALRNGCFFLCITVLYP